MQTAPVQTQFYRDDASRLRREAEAISHKTIRQQLLSIATDYDGLADVVETINRQRGMG
jgi:hypothetical protein